MTEQCAKGLLREELTLFAAKVDKLVKKPTQNQFDALVSFAYNVGTGALSGSTLLKKHNAGEYLEAQEQFLRWDKAAGKVLAGLIKRRAHEAALYGK
jgi:lysozyme